MESLDRFLKLLFKKGDLVLKTSPTFQMYEIYSKFTKQKQLM